VPRMPTSSTHCPSFPDDARRRRHRRPIPTRHLPWRLRDVHVSLLLLGVPRPNVRPGQGRRRGRRRVQQAQVSGGHHPAAPRVALHAQLSADVRRPGREKWVVDRTRGSSSPDFSHLSHPPPSFFCFRQPNCARCALWQTITAECGPNNAVECAQFGSWAVMNAQTKLKSSDNATTTLCLTKWHWVSQVKRRRVMRWGVFIPRRLLRGGADRVALCGRVCAHRVTLCGRVCRV